MSVVLRLVLDRHGQMIHGEVVGDANEHPARFSGWRGLTRAVQVWLAGHEQDSLAFRGLHIGTDEIAQLLARAGRTSLSVGRLA